MTDWSGFIAAGILVLIRVSGLMLFVPFFSSAAIPRTVKAVFTVVVAALLTPIAASHPGALPELGLTSMLGELSTGLLFGLSLTLLMEMLNFSGQLLGLQFSFSLVNVLDPNSSIETPSAQPVVEYSRPAGVAGGRARSHLAFRSDAYLRGRASGNSLAQHTRQPHFGRDDQRSVSCGGAIIGAGHCRDASSGSRSGAGRSYVAAAASLICRHSA